MTSKGIAGLFLLGLLAVSGAILPSPVAAAETRKCLSEVSLADIGRGVWVTSEVRDLQLFLKDLGHYVPDIKESELTGRIGARTKVAISSFQQSEGLESTGTIGPKTADRINSISCGMQKAAPVSVAKPAVAQKSSAATPAREPATSVARPARTSAPAVTRALVTPAQVSNDMKRSSSAAIDPSPRVAYPNTGEILPSGVETVISWEIGADEGPFDVSIMNVADNTSVYVARNVTLNAVQKEKGAMSVRFTPVFSVERAQFLAVVCVSGSRVCDQSNEAFTIAPTGSPTLLFPKGGEALLYEQASDISWNPNDSRGPFDVILRSYPSRTQYILAERVPYEARDKMSVSWTPRTGAYGNEFEFRIRVCRSGSASCGETGIPIYLRPASYGVPTIRAISSSLYSSAIINNPTELETKAVNGGMVYVDGANFNQNTRIIIDGNTRGPVVPQEGSVYSTELAFNVPTGLALGRHTFQVGDPEGSVALSNRAGLTVVPPTKFTLYANGKTGDDVLEAKPDQKITYQLKTEGLFPSDAGSSPTYEVINGGSNCNGPRWGEWTAPTPGGTRTDKVEDCQEGTTYRLNYPYSDGVRGASTYAIVKVLGPATAASPSISTSPTAQFTANDSTSITVSPGDTIRYKWSSTGGSRFVSNFSADQASCGAGANGPWYANNAASGERSDTVQDCQAGRLYTLTYDVSNSSGQTVRKTVSVRVLSLRESVPTATFTANGSQDITVNVGDSINYAWTSTGGRSYVSNVIADQPSCGGPANTSWFANGTANGQRTDVVGECQAGRTYRIAYDVITGVQSAHAEIIVRVRSTSEARPTATFTANGADDITVNAGDQITYSWSGGVATGASSRWSSDQASCSAGSGGTWNANTTAGSRTDTVGECQAGRTYSITYIAANASLSTEKSVTVRVRPVLKFTANGSVVTSVAPSGSVTYALQIIPADGAGRITNAYATYTRTQADACGPVGETGPWTPPALNSSRTDTASSCQTGGEYRITYHYVLDGRTEEKSVLVGVRATTSFLDFSTRSLGSVFQGIANLFDRGQ